MEKRINLLFAIPLGLALAAFFLSRQFLPTALAFILGIGILYAVRTRLIPARVDRAVRLYRRNNMEEALVAADEAVSAHPDRWEPYYVRALIHFDRPDHDAALRDAHRAIELRPRVGSNHAVLGQVLFWQGRYEEALNAFSRASELDRKDPLNHFYAGASLFQLGRYGSAIPRFELALGLKIPLPELELLSHYYLATALQAEGHTEEAEEGYTRLKKMNQALDVLQEDLRRAPYSPALPHLQKDAEAIRRRIQ